MTIPRPEFVAHATDTGYACIGFGVKREWMTVDDLFDQAFAWFDVARELRGRNLAVEAVNQGPPPEVVFEPEAMA